MLEKYKFDDGWFLNVTNSPVDIAYCVIGANEFRFLTKKESRSAGPALEMSVENGRIAGPFPSLADVEGHRKMLNMKGAMVGNLPPVESPPEEPPVEDAPAAEVLPEVVDGQQQPEDVGGDQSSEEVSDDVKKSTKRKGK